MEYRKKCIYGGLGGWGRDGLRLERLVGVDGLVASP
jgi:hypothetical protein